MRLAALSKFGYNRVMDFKQIDVPFTGINSPEYQSAGAAGADIRAKLDKKIRLKTLERVLVPTGLYLAIPQGYEGQLRPRSGLAMKYGLTMVNSPGTIDADYRGEIKVLLINLGTEDFTIEDGMRIGQLLISPVMRADFIPQDQLDHCSRGEKGFGSTGSF